MVTAACRELLAAYQVCLEESPPPPRVLLQRRKSTGPSRHVWVPRLAIAAAVRFFVKQHIHRSLDRLVCAYQRRAALDEATDEKALAAYAAEIKRLEQFRASLGRRPPYKVLSTLLLFGALLASFTLVSALPVPRQDRTLPFLRDVSDQLFQLPPDVSDLWKTMASAGSSTETAAATSATGESASARTTDDKIEGADLEVMVYAALTLLIALYLLLRVLPIGSFNVKRLRFSLYPAAIQSDGPISRVEPADHCTGVYEMERTLFQQLGAGPPREVPFDLLRSAALMAPPVVASVLVLVGAGLALTVDAPSASGTFEVVGLVGTLTILLLAALPVARLAHLRRTWVERSTAEAATIEGPPRSRRRRLATVSLWAVGVAGLYASGASENDQASPRHWGAVALVLAALGVLMVAVAWATRPRGVITWGAAAGFAFVGSAGLVGLHHPVLSVAGPSLLLAAAVFFALARRPMPRRRQVAGGGALLTALALLAVGVAALPPVEPYPSAQELRVLALLPGDVKCQRPQGRLIFRESIGINCKVTDDVGFSIHRFATVKGARAQFGFDGHRLPERDCDPRTNEEFEGVSTYTVDAKTNRVECFTDPDGMPFLEWTDDAHAVYGYAFVFVGQEDRERKREFQRAMYDAWKTLFASAG